MTDPLAHDTGTGLVMSEADWLRIHYQACAAGYAEQLAFCRFPPGSKLVDVGCGPGLFLPELARRLGPGGEIVACDLSEAHLEEARRTVGDELDGCRIDYRVGDALALPFADHSFEAYWSANVSQYFDDDRFRRMLSEARRVTRPGGTVAIKEWDASLFRVEPSEPGTTQRLMEACRRAFLNGNRASIAVNIHRAVACSHIRHWLTDAGFRDARQHSTLIEFSAPLSPLTRDWCGRMLGMFAQVAGQLGSPDQEFWTRLRDDAPGRTILADPGFYCSEGSMVGVALAP